MVVAIARRAWPAGEPALGAPRRPGARRPHRLANTFLPRWSEDHPLLARSRRTSPRRCRSSCSSACWCLAGGAPAPGASRPAGGGRPAAALAGGNDPQRVLTRLTRVAAVCSSRRHGVVVFTQADPSWLFLVTQAVILARSSCPSRSSPAWPGRSRCARARSRHRRLRGFQLTDRWGCRCMLAALVGAATPPWWARCCRCPVLRLGACGVAIATLAFAYFFDCRDDQAPWIGGGDTSLLQGTWVPRPTIGPWGPGRRQAVPGAGLVVLVVRRWR